METLRIAEAKSRFSELLSRASSGERFIIRRRERPVAALVSIEELERMDRASRAAEHLAEALGQSKELVAEIEAGEANPAMAAFGMWRDEDGLESLAEEIMANRSGQDERPGADL